MHSWDYHGRGINFSIGEGTYIYSTGWGFFCTIMALLICLCYGVEKVFVQDNLSFYTETHVYEPNAVFGQQDGFNIAFALSPYTGLLNRRFEHPSNYTLEVYLYSWSLPKNALVTRYSIK